MKKRRAEFQHSLLVLFIMISIFQNHRDGTSGLIGLATVLCAFVLMMLNFIDYEKARRRKKNRVKS